MLRAIRSAAGPLPVARIAITVALSGSDQFAVAHRDRFVHASYRLVNACARSRAPLPEHALEFAERPPDPGTPGPHAVPSPKLRRNRLPHHIASIEVARALGYGAGWTRTSDQGIMSPVL